ADWSVIGAANVVMLWPSGRPGSRPGRTARSAAAGVLHALAAAGACPINGEIMSRITFGDDHFFCSFGTSEATWYGSAWVDYCVSERLGRLPNGLWVLVTDYPGSDGAGDSIRPNQVAEHLSDAAALAWYSKWQLGRKGWPEELIPLVKRL